ncbi:serine/threonine-protein kinase STY13-like [Oryza brachyantha]|uniref:Protein kinase domain-containing protein n=1 Tax=Oryza brachyantha TaxID=4533 RepID=J3M5A4_ORYBR|nr:serine/threonine-protein kinase STY13-like [Oryza brachyantha]
MAASSSLNSGSEVPTAAWEIDLSRLQINDFVKQGSQGTLFCGKYDGRDVAVKLLEWGRDGHSTPEQIICLGESLRELAAAWDEMDHPNIAKFIGAFIGKSPPPDTTSFVLTERLNGGTLREYLDKHTKCKLNYKNAVNLALGMARGLSYLHSRQIVHHNVRTENMLLDDNVNIKIADFGVSCIDSDPKDMTGRTGTSCYKAPEVLDGKPYNHKCDVYSFGICLWEIYCCANFIDVTSAALHNQLRPKIPKCCPQDMARIMRMCWDVEPASRPEMHEVVGMLEKLNTKKGHGMVPAGQPSGCSCFSIKHHFS